MPVLAWAPKGKKADAMSSFANAGGGVGWVHRNETGIWHFMWGGELVT